MMAYPTTFDVLGLSEQAAGGLSAEDFMPEQGSGSRSVNGVPVAQNCTLVAKALRGLADSIDAKRIDIVKMGVSADIEREKVIIQKFTLDFCIPVNR